MRQAAEPVNRTGYLLDTHIWIWQLEGSDRVSRSLATLINDAADRLWLSPVSVWELGLLERSGRVQLAGGYRRWVEEAQRRVPVHEATLTREVAIRSHEIDLPQQDPADRFLAATALVYGLTLLTTDERLKSADWLPTL